MKLTSATNNANAIVPAPTLNHPNITNTAANNNIPIANISAVSTVADTAIIDNTMIINQFINSCETYSVNGNTTLLLVHKSPVYVFCLTSPSSTNHIVYSNDTVSFSYAVKSIASVDNNVYKLFTLYSDAPFVSKNNSPVSSPVIVTDVLMILATSVSD